MRRRLGGARRIFAVRRRLGHPTTARRKWLLLRPDLAHGASAHQSDPRLQHGARGAGAGRTPSVHRRRRHNRGGDGLPEDGAPAVHPRRLLLPELALPPRPPRPPDGAGAGAVAGRRRRRRRHLAPHVHRQPVHVRRLQPEVQADAARDRHVRPPRRVGRARDLAVHRQEPVAARSQRLPRRPAEARPLSAAPRPDGAGRRRSRSRQHPHRREECVELGALKIFIKIH